MLKYFPLLLSVFILMSCEQITEISSKKSDLEAIDDEFVDTEFVDTESEAPAEKQNQDDTTSPKLTILSPGASLFPRTTSSVNISFSADENSVCRYSQSPGQNFATMSSLANTNAAIIHSLDVSVVPGLSYSYYFKCQDQGLNTSADNIITFRIDDAAATNGNIFESFSSDQLPSIFQLKNTSEFNLQIDQGHLKMSLNSCNGEECVWYRESSGPLVHTTFSGNFKMTTLVRVKDTQDLSLSLPLINATLFAGLIARDPNSGSGQENYVFSVVGLRGSAQYTNELKSTVNNTSSVWEKSSYLSTLSELNAEIRICRIGQVFQFYVKENNIWVKNEREANRSSTDSALPDTLQVGMIVYDYYSEDRIQGEFDYFSVEAISSEEECRQD